MYSFVCTMISSVLKTKRRIRDSIQAWMFVCICVSTCICAFMYTCMYGCTHVRIHLRIHVCIYVYIHVCMYVSRNACVHAYIYTQPDWHTSTFTTTNTKQIDTAAFKKENLHEHHLRQNAFCMSYIHTWLDTQTFTHIHTNTQQIVWTLKKKKKTCAMVNSLRISLLSASNFKPASHTSTHNCHLCSAACTRVCVCACLCVCVCARA